MEMVRCPACRGSKKVAKLGGMLGDCNTCLGKGEVKECDRPNMVMAPVPEPVADIVSAVSHAVATSPEPVTQELPLAKPKGKFPPSKPLLADTKPKANIYKRKGG